MKDQIQFETNGLTVLAVKYPDEDSGLCYPKIGWTDLYFDLKDGDYASVPIPQGVKWKIHANSNNIDEDYWHGLVLRKTIYSGLVMFKFFDYVNKKFSYDSIIDSANSLLRSHGIDPNEKYVLLIKEI